MQTRNKLKFMQSLDPDWVGRVQASAKKRGITVQEMIRAVIVPDWYKHHPLENRKE